MSISTARAKQLCTASELTLVKSSSRSEICKLSAARLRQKITRARKLRDKSARSGLAPEASHTVSAAGASHRRQHPLGGEGRAVW